jgi:hypothetical protein
VENHPPHSTSAKKSQKSFMHLRDMDYSHWYYQPLNNVKQEQKEQKDWWWDFFNNWGEEHGGGCCLPEDMGWRGRDLVIKNIKD